MYVNWQKPWHARNTIRALSSWGPQILSLKFLSLGLMVSDTWDFIVLSSVYMDYKINLIHFTEERFVISQLSLSDCSKFCRMCKWAEENYLGNITGYQSSDLWEWFFKKLVLNWEWVQSIPKKLCCPTQQASSFIIEFRDTLLQVKACAVLKS